MPNSTNDHNEHLVMPYIVAKKYLLNVILLLASMAVTFCASELFIRLYYPEPENKGQLYRKEWNRDYKKSALLPNAEVIHFGVPTKINSLGLKNEEIQLTKSENMLRISMFGDSVTYGEGLSLGETLPSQLEKLLNRDKPYPYEIQVLNFGVCGMNTFQEVMYALNYGSQFAPNIVMIVWFYNDIEMNGYKLEGLETFKETRTVPQSNSSSSPSIIGENIGSYRGRNSFTMWFWNCYEKLKIKSRLLYLCSMRTKKLLQKLGLNLKTSEEVIYADLNSDGFRLSLQSLKLLNDELARQGIEFYTVFYPPLQQLDSDYYNNLINKKVEGYCRSHNIECLNLYSVFKGKKPSQLHVSKMDGHPNRYANESAANKIEEYLEGNSKFFKQEK